MKQILVLISCFLSFITAQLDYTEHGDSEEYSDYMNQATKLYDELFTTRNYNKYLSPVYVPMPENFTESPIPRLRVNMVLRYVKMFNLDAEGQILSLCLQFVMDWRDPRLAWNETKFGGIPYLFSTPDILWTPDQQFGNVKSLDTAHPVTAISVKIYSNGTVVLPLVFYAELACPLEVSTFPFDQQDCPIPLGSLSYEVKFSYMTGSVNNMNVANPGNGEWLVTNITIAPFNVDTPTQTICPVFHIKRVPNFYVYVIALPCFITTLLAIVGMFWTPVVKSEQLVKLSIGLTSLVSMTVLLDMLAAAIPKTSVFPLLGIYVLSCILVISLACILVIIYSQPDVMRKCSMAKLKKQEEAKTGYLRVCEPDIVVDDDSDDEVGEVTHPIYAQDD
ncbi:unnamed protein product, partial [Mesorhabditis belari]|uniref:Neurotransmitter-gated ion-channel ligand-binding domain-containing protein n=1 Tax=Mesorhabditis belari TaxID=2138241 RepID=A0AAF3EMK4_9BILA